MIIFLRPIFFCLVTVFCGLVLPSPVPAHALKIFATAEGQTITGMVYFRGGSALPGLPVGAYDPEGELLLTTLTDAEGRFILEANRRCDLRLVAETVDGHRAEFSVPAAGATPDRGDDLSARIASEGSSAPPETADQDALALLIERAVARQLLPLQEQIDRYHQRLRVQDAVAGLGYIMGLAGLALYGAARKKKDSAR